MNKRRVPDAANVEMSFPNLRHRRPLQQTTIPPNWGQLKNLNDRRGPNSHDPQTSKFYDLFLVMLFMIKVQVKEMDHNY